VSDTGKWRTEEAIRMLTSEGADLFGLTDRGRLSEGGYADVNIIDLQGMELNPPEFGYDLTMVNGEVFMRDGDNQGSLVARVLR